MAESVRHKESIRHKESVSNAVREGGTMIGKKGSDCQICKKKGKHNEAVGYCKDCTKYLCDSCLNDHRHTKQTKHHTIYTWKLVTTKSFLKPKLRSTKSMENTCTIKCEEHPDKVIESYCCEHEVLGCSLCVARAHMGCENVKYIPEICSNLDGEDYKGIIMDLITVTQKSLSVIRELNSLKHKAEKYKVNIENEIQQYRKQVNTIVAELEDEVIKQADTSKAEDIDKLNYCVSKYEHVCQEADRLVSILQSLHQSKQNYKLFVTMKKTRKSMVHLNHRLQSKEDTSCMMYFFRPNTETLRMLDDIDMFGNIEEKGMDTHTKVKEKVLEIENKTMDAASLSVDNNENSPVVKVRGLSFDKLDGKPEETSNPDSPESLTEPSVENEFGVDVDTSAIEEAEVCPIEVEHVEDIIAKSETDSYPVSISSSVLLIDYNVIVVDTTNWSLKLIDTQKSMMIQTLKLHGCPWDITNMDENRVAVTMPILQRITLFKYEHMFTSECDVTQTVLRKERNINVRGHCYGVAYTREKLIVSYARDWMLGKGETKIEVLNLDGHVLQSIIGDIEEEKLFLNPKYITVGKDEDTFYISDWGDSSVTCVNTDSSTIAMFKSKALKQPCKLVKDSNNTFYVCGQNSSNIHRIDADCYQIQVLLAGEGVVQPRSLSLCEDLGLLYVGMLGCDKIKVYSFQ